MTNNQKKIKKKITSRYPSPRIPQIIKNLECVSKSEKGSPEFLKQFVFYLKCRVAELTKSYETIEKEKDRIRKIKKCIEYTIENIVDNSDKKKELRNIYIKW